MDVRLIQKKVPIGSIVNFALNTGLEIIGSLTEIGRDHVTIESDNGSKTIHTEMIGMFEVLEQETVRSEKEASDERYYDVKVIEKLIEIESRFKAMLQTANIELKEPDFSIPQKEIERWGNTDALAIWHRIKNRYEYAKKINEISAKFGRIQPITSELKSLTKHIPFSSHLKRHLAYLYSLQGNQKESIKLYHNAALLSHDKYDWLNTAGLALKSNDEELTCYCLEKVFHKMPISKEIGAWHVFVKLIKKFKNYPSLRRLYETTERELSENEIVILIESGIYLFKSINEEIKAKEFVEKWIGGEPLKSLAEEIFKLLKDQPTESYTQVVKEFIDEEKKIKNKTELKEIQRPQGYISSFIQDRNFGFIEDLSGTKYFFHRSAVVDEFLYSKLKNLTLKKQIPVVFETTHGSKGPLAIQISLFRTIDELFELANNYADSGEYSKAIAQIKRLITLNPNYPNAQDNYEKWREYARSRGVPQGTNPYARAKRMQLVEKDLDKAVQLFREAIKRNDNVESAIKDIAMLLVQLGRLEEAIEVLRKNRNKIREQQSVDNLFISLYQSAGQYDLSIALLQKNLKLATKKEKKTSIFWQIANSYLKKEDYKQAEQTFKEIIHLNPDHKPAQRNIALCLIKQERYDEADEILNKILDTSADTKAAELLEAITQARETGKSAEVEEIVIETTLSDLSGELSEFARFFLNRSEFQGVAPERIRKDERGITRYEGSERDARFDLETLNKVAKEFGTRRPRDRAGFYLSAAKITLEKEDNPEQCYRYLCRAFASRGDAAVTQNLPMDAVRQWYCEALSVYDGVRSQRKDEQDAVNALVRFLFSTLGLAHVPITPKIPSIAETIEDVINRHPQRDKVFDLIAYLVLNSRYAANRILNRLYEKTTLQAMALEYLKKISIYVPEDIRSLDDFVHLWNELRRKKFSEIRTISTELSFLRNLELTTARLENSIKQIKGIIHRLFFDLDQQRIGNLQTIFETALELCKQVSFEEKERLCIQINSRCQDLLTEIEENPSKISIEQVYPILTIMQEKIKVRLDELYETSKPQLELRLPVESLTPDPEQKIEVQIVIANKLGRSPAESLELVIQDDEEFFSNIVSEIKLDESLRGGEQKILKIPLCVTDKALESQTFSLPIYAQYHTRSDEVEQTDVNTFSIRLYSEAEFEEIDNPYVYAESGIVDDPDMFYGRGELIKNIAQSIKKSYAQSKSIIVFGQKRSGKSSILYHLKSLLEKEKDSLILDLGNIGSILDEHSKLPFTYQILWNILTKLRDEIEDREDEGFSRLKLFFPSDIEFYNHPSPIMAFKEIFERYKRVTSKQKNWQKMRIVILIDEFSYIYGLIDSGKIPELFMKNWKAILQENYFNSVLAGQDVMPKFKYRFPNEFGTTQDERISYLKREDAIKLIDEPIRIGGQNGESRYRERAIERILDLSASSPFYIQIICNRLVEFMNRKRARLVTEADVEQVKNELIKGVNALSLDKFDNLINSGDTSNDAITDEDALKVLKSIAMNSKIGPCNRNNITCETSSPIDIILEDLVKREVIEREQEQYYQIKVGLFREWLITN